MTKRIGQSVVYVMGDSDVKSCLRTDGYNGHRDHPAVITQVWDNDAINLKVLFDMGPVEDRGTVSHKSNAAEGEAYWREAIEED